MVTELLEQLSKDYETKGSSAILDRVCDEDFCKELGLKYGDRYNFSIIEQTLVKYNKEK